MDATHETSYERWADSVICTAELGDTTAAGRPIQDATLREIVRALPRGHRLADRAALCLANRAQYTR